LIGTFIVCGGQAVGDWTCQSFPCRGTMATSDSTSSGGMAHLLFWQLNLETGENQTIYYLL